MWFLKENKIFAKNLKCNSNLIPLLRTFSTEVRTYGKLMMKRAKVSEDKILKKNF